MSKEIRFLILLSQLVVSPYNRVYPTSHIYILFTGKEWRPESLDDEEGIDNVG